MLLVLAAAKQVGLRCSQGFARSTGDVRQPGRLVSGGYPGRRLVFPSIIYWFKVSFLRGSPSAFDAWWHANNPLLGATTCPLVWRLMLLVLAAAKQVGLRCSQGFARSTGDVRQPGRLVSGGYPGRRLVCSRASSIGLRCRFCEVHRRHLMHGGTQTIRFWGLQHVHWCEGSCCWFLRLQSRLAWDVPKALQGRQGMCGSLAGWFQVAIQAVDWCSRASSIGLSCRFCEVHRRHLMHGGTQTIRFWGLQHVHWCEGSCCWFLRLQSRLVWDVPKALQGRQGMCGSLAGWFQVAIQAVDWCSRASSIGLRCRFCEVHRRHLMHGGTQTIRFWGLQHVHWCEGSCCWFLRLQSRLAWDVPKALQGRQGMCGSLAGWFQVAIQAVDWCSRASSIGLRCRFCEVHRRHLMHGGTQTIRFWGLQHVHWCEGSCCWFLRLQSRLVWDVPKALQGRQGMCGSLAGWFQVAIQAVDWFVPEHHLLV